MQDKKVKDKEEIMTIDLPMEAIIEAGFTEATVIQISACAGKIVLEAVEEEDLEDYVCDRNCWSCPCINVCRKAVK